MKTKSLPIELPRIDADTQSRIKINDDTVVDYADLIEASEGEWPFPPIDVFHDGSDYYVADGFHRLLGALRTKRGTIPCRVHKGTAFDARIFGMTANDRNGLRMTRADKKACVEWLLDCGDKMTQGTIAESAGVSVRTVKTIVADRKYDATPTPTETPETAKKVQLAPFTPTSGDSDPPETDEPIEADSESVDDPETPVDYGKCPNCASTKWKDCYDDGNVICSRCNHPHGEPAGDADEDRMQTQRQKTVKTGEALMRAFDDLQCMKAKPGAGEVIEDCKRLIEIARNWK